MQDRFILNQERLLDQKVPFSAKALFFVRDFLKAWITSLKPHRFRIIQQLGTPIFRGTYWGVQGKTRGPLRLRLH